MAFGNVSDVVDLNQIATEILSAYKTVYGSNSGEAAIYNTHGKYDILTVIPSLSVLYDIISECLRANDYDPTLYKFKAWFNVCHKDEYLKMHTHECTTHGYMVVSNTNCKTRFSAIEDFVLDNKDGQVVNLFGRYRHGVEPNVTDRPRITVAWDCCLKEYETEAIYYDL